jgi:hypothetical protein
MNRTIWKSELGWMILALASWSGTKGEVLAIDELDD